MFRTSFPLCPLDGASLEPLEGGDPMVGTTLDGRYIIEECVGEGGMGRIYRAQHRNMSRRFAIKMLFGDLAADDKMRARFHQEGEAACRLAHPNVVSVVDVGETEARQPYLAMDYVDGVSLKRLIRRDAPMESRRVAALLWQLASGLSHAHQKGLVHRDFKPGNVLVVDEGRGEVPKILDFGIARIMEEGYDNDLTTEGQVMGTPAYMSPEHAMGEELDNRTDLFSLGVVLYQMLCGKLPHEGRGHELLRKNMVVQAPPISTRVPGLVVDPVLEAIALRLMAKNPAERFQSGQEVVKLLVDSSLVRMDSRKAGEPRITLLRVSEPVPEPHDRGPSGAVPMAANQSGAFTPVPMMAGQSGAFTPAPMMAGQSGGFASPPGNVGMVPSLAPRAGTMPPVIVGTGTSAPVPQAGPTLAPGQQWTRPPTQGDGTVHVRVAGGANTNRIRILIAATVGMLGIIIAILLYQKFTPKEGENSASPMVDAGVDAPVDGHPTPLVADAGAPEPDAQEPADAAIPDARTRVVTNGQRPRRVTRGDFKKRYIQVGRLVNQLLDARRGWPTATRLQERYLKIEYEDAMDDATLRRIEHKKLGRLKTDIKKHLPRK